MRKEPAFQSAMLSDFQLWGVDKVDGYTATIVGQIVCTDAGRWPVQREFNRRLKIRAQQLGIELANPRRSFVVRERATGEAVDDDEPTARQVSDHGSPDRQEVERQPLERRQGGGGRMGVARKAERP
jgi:hypothetical protein